MKFRENLLLDTRVKWLLQIIIIDYYCTYTSSEEDRDRGVLKLGIIYIHLFFYFLSDSCKNGCCVDIFAIDNVGDIREDTWLPTNKSIQNVLL